MLEKAGRSVEILVQKILEKKFSPTGNRTPASRVTGGDTDHYTIEDLILRRK